jgi:hypothetical protein
MGKRKQGTKLIFSSKFVLSRVSPPDLDFPYLHLTLKGLDEISTLEKENKGPNSFSHVNLSSAEFHPQILDFPYLHLTLT